MRQHREEVEKIKKTVIVITEHELTKEERVNYERDHPGYRLCFRLRYPNFPLYVEAVALVFSIATLLWILLVK